MNSKKHWIIFIAILALAAFLRLYRIEDYMGFLGDEGRDALVVKHMIVDHKLTLLGPITSVGLMHLGPAYYYFMAPFLWAAGLNPVGPAIMVALFSLATIWLIWKLVREFFSTRAAIIASLFYAISPLVIIHSHSSWNPNILPFWGLLIIYGLLQVVVHKKYLWLIVVGLSLGIVVQLHYIAFVFVPIILACLGLVRFKIPLKYWVGLCIGGLITFSPFLLFELRHQFINTLTVIQFVTRSGEAKTFTVMTFFARFWDLSVRLFWRLILITNAEISIVVMLLVMGVSVFLLYHWQKEDKKRLALSVLLLWFFVGIGMLSFYTGNIYDYYLMFVFPLPFILVGLVTETFTKHRVLQILAVGILSMLAYVHLQQTPILKEPNRLAQQSQEIAQFILNKAGGKPYNFALIAGGNSDHAYRYFLEIGKNPPTVIKNQTDDPGRSSVTDQLFIVCEEKVCQPLGHPLWEIAGYGRADIADQWSVGLFKVFKLVPYNPTVK